jgi:hypothetical protein
MTSRVVNDTLSVDARAGDDPHITIERTAGGLVRVELYEVRGLLRALNSAACELVSEVVAAEREAGEGGERWPLILT